MNYIYDTETFPNCFLLCAVAEQSGNIYTFEISPWRDDTQHLNDFLLYLKSTHTSMVGFNNLNFDYPILHALRMMSKPTPEQLYAKAMAIINSDDKFAHLIYASDRYVPQIDLFKIHHFDNKSRMTSLKAIEFNMRMESIQDLPFPPGTVLTQEQIVTLRDYCAHDVEATRLFYLESLDAIKFRQSIAGKYAGDVMNSSDVKLGKMIFQNHLQTSGVQCYVGSQPKQTIRPVLHLRECVPDYVHFDHPEFDRIRQHFLNSSIRVTKGAFDGLSAKVGGLEFVFGTGGIHASVNNERFDATDDMMILDVDVTSMYPSIAIKNNYYPEHLGPEFVSVYRQLLADRVKHPKGSVENAALKLALNGVYGASGDPYSIFFDTLFTMKITVGGQLMMAMLAEQLLQVPGLRIIQANTDGVTLYFPRNKDFLVEMICMGWQRLTRLTLEHVEYKLMCVADVNSYLAQSVDGKIKRKGRYEYDVGWHQDASMLVIPKIAEKVLTEGVGIDDTLRNWPERMDFMGRVKVPRSSHLMWESPAGVRKLENTQRYYASIGGGKMIKHMPPLAKNPGVRRRIGVMAGVDVCPCNHMDEATLPINYDWYRSEIETLTYGVM